MESLSPYHRGMLIAHADDVSHTLIDKCGRAAVSEPTYTNEHGWYIEVVGLLGDIPMDTVIVFPNGSRELVS